jgi:hypothetical protein
MKAKQIIFLFSMFLISQFAIHTSNTDQSTNKRFKKFHNNCPTYLLLKLRKLEAELLKTKKEQAEMKKDLLATKDHIRAMHESRSAQEIKLREFFH